MAGRTPHEAVREFVGPLQLALSCVTSEVIRAGGYHVADEPHALTLGRGLPVRLRGEGRLALTFDHHYRIVEDPGARGPYKCATTSYLYGLDDPSGREVLSYQWHPSGRSPVTWPHLHLGAGAEVSRIDLARAHLPTGRVSIEEVLRMAITELDVEPLREDWREVLYRVVSTETAKVDDFRGRRDIPRHRPLPPDTPWLLLADISMFDTAADALRIAAIEREHARDGKPRGWRDRSAHRTRRQLREQHLAELDAHRERLLDRVPEPRTVLERADQLRHHQRALGAEHRRARELAIEDEVATRPPWLEQALGPEPEDNDRRARWSKTAREIAGHRIDHHILWPRRARCLCWQ